MKQMIVVLLLVVGASLLLTVLAVQLAPDLLDNTGGIVAVFAGVFVAFMALGGGTIKGWVETLFGKEEKKEGDTIVEKGGIYVGPGGKVEQRFDSLGETRVENDLRLEVAEPTLSKEEARTAYLSALVDDFRTLSLPGMDIRSGDILQAKLRLEDIYISLNTTAQEEKDGTGQKRAETEQELMAQPGRENKPLTVLEALLRAPDRHMVLTGMPGTGKSTFVKYLSLRLAKQLLDPNEKLLENWGGKPLFPLVISLGRFAETLDDDVKKGSAEMVEKYLVSSLVGDKRMKHFAPYVLRILEEEGGLILFDGLDEVAKMHLRPIVVQAIESFTEKYMRRSQSRFLVTCRVLSYENMSKKLAGWREYEIALFSQEQIREFIERWYTLHAAQETGRAMEYTRKKPELLAAVQVGEPRRLHEVARYPIVLTMIAIVHASYELPDNRAEVYEQCVDLLLNKWQYTRSIGGIKETRSLAAELNLPPGSIYEPLYEIAFKAHEGHSSERGRTEDSGSLITEGFIDGILHDHWQDRTKVDTFIEYCQRSNGLLMWRGTVELAGSNVRRNEYTFPHLTFEEFLASRYLQDREPEEARRLLDDAHDRWREPIKFLGESYCFNKVPKRSQMDGLLRALCRPFSNPTLPDWRALWLAGELLTYYKRAWAKKKSDYEDEIIENLRRLVFEAPLSPRERADAADVYDQLAPLNDLHEFVRLPNFAISKYPVTNKQYERFLRPENFQNKSLWVNFPKHDENSQPMNETWGEEAWNWLQNELQDKDNDIQDGMLLPRYWRDPRFGVNRRCAPVVGISWYEASAYCNWLLMNWDKLDEGKQGLPKPEWVRLPLDTEWTLAAGGEAEERFAFGVLKNPKEEIIAHANTSESKIGRTTPVWMYSEKGASPATVMDMSGNVWEWQADYFDKDHDYPGLRGGSWGSSGDYARVSLRYSDLPEDRSSYIGFRVVVCLPNG
jgi:formylglycine-generating enzyme required for sulfatase activity